MLLYKTCIGARPEYSLFLVRFKADFGDFLPRKKTNKQKTAPCGVRTLAGNFLMLWTEEAAYQS
jgi:hypothetical protein